MPSVPSHVNLPRITIDCRHPDVNKLVLGIKSLRLLLTGQTVRGLRLKRVRLLHKFSNICKPEEGCYGQPKYCYKKQHTLF